MDLGVAIKGKIRHGCGNGYALYLYLISVNILHVIFTIVLQNGRIWIKCTLNLCSNYLKKNTF